MGKRPTLADVARLAGISTAQASTALNDSGRVAAATVERVRAAADELGYRPDQVARALRTGTGRDIGLIVRNLSNSYFLDVIRGMDEVCATEDSTLFIVDSNYDRAMEQRAVERMVRARVAALAIAPISGSEAVDWWRERMPSTPLVLVNAAPQPGVITVGPDGALAVEQALAEFRRLGHRRVAFVGAARELQADTDRTERFYALCAEWGMAGELLESQLTFAAVVARIGAVLDDPNGHRAFLMNSDYTASAVYTAARERGLVVGSDVSVIGHDSIPTSALFDPPMTTVWVDRREVGRVAARTLLSWVTGAKPMSRSLPTELVTGSSVAPRK